MKREPLLCDCHRRAIMAEREGSLIIIRDKRGDGVHTLVIDIEREYNRLKELERQRAPTASLSGPE